jgi:DNA-binding response OmpR family regulator
MSIEPGRMTRAAIHCDAGDVEVRLTAAGNWQLAVRGAEEREWRMACSGDLHAGSASLGLERDNPPTRYGQLLLDTEDRRVFVAGQALQTTPLEFGLLATLASDPSRVFTKQELMQAVWGYNAMRSSRTLDTHASHVRVLLRKAGAPGFVVCVRGVGYRLWSKGA